MGTPYGFRQFFTFSRFLGRVFVKVHLLSSFIGIFGFMGIIFEKFSRFMGILFRTFSEFTGYTFTI